MRPVLVLSALALLAACGTPLERCIDRNTVELRKADRMIAETRGNIERGYALERVQVLVRRPALCTLDDGRSVFCSRNDWDWQTRRKDIVIEAEQAKLAVLIKKRDDLAIEAQPRIAECQAQYPA